MSLDFGGLGTIAGFAQNLQVGHSCAATLGYWNDVVELESLVCAALNASTQVASPHFAAHGLGDGLAGCLFMRQRGHRSLEGDLPERRIQFLEGCKLVVSLLGSVATGGCSTLLAAVLAGVVYGSAVWADLKKEHVALVAFRTRLHEEVLRRQVFEATDKVCSLPALVVGDAPIRSEQYDRDQNADRESSWADQAGLQVLHVPVFEHLVLGFRLLARV